MSPKRTEEVWPVPSTVSDGPSRGRILVHVDPATDHHSTLEVARALADGTAAEIVLLQAEIFPEQTPLNLTTDTMDAAKAQLEAIVDEFTTDHDGSLSAVVRAGHTLDALLASAASEHEADFVVVDGDVPDVQTIVGSVGCDVVTVRNQTDWERTQSVLVPVSGGPHSQLAARTGGAVARAVNGWVELVHVVPSEPTRDERENAEEMLTGLAGQVDVVEDVDTVLVEGDDVADAIIERSEYYDVTIIGAPTKSRLAHFAYGSTSGRIHENAEELVLTVWDRARHR